MHSRMMGVAEHYAACLIKGTWGTTGNRLYVRDFGATLLRLNCGTAEPSLEGTIANI